MSTSAPHGRAVVSAFHWRALGLLTGVQKTPLCRRHGALKVASYVADDTCMAELEGRTTRLAVLLGVSVIVISLAAAFPHRANEMGGGCNRDRPLHHLLAEGQAGFRLFGLGHPLRLVDRRDPSSQASLLLGLALVRRAEDDTDPTTLRPPGTGPSRSKLTIVP